MAGSLYNAARQLFGLGGINWTNDEIRVAVLSSGYVANMFSDQFFSDVTAGSGLAPPVILTGKTISTAGFPGNLGGDNVVTAPIAAGVTISQFVIYKNTGVAATSNLIARQDVIPPVPANGGTVSIVWDPLGIFSL